MTTVVLAVTDVGVGIVLAGGAVVVAGRMVSKGFLFMVVVAAVLVEGMTLAEVAFVVSVCAPEFRRW